MGKERFRTPSIREAIWCTTWLTMQEGDRMFSSIESAPIVRNRDMYMLENRMADSAILSRRRIALNEVLSKEVGWKSILSEMRMSTEC